MNGNLAIKNREHDFFYDGSTPLIIASDRGHVEIVKLLLSQPGIEINSKDDKGRTPLMYSAYEGRTEIVQILVIKTKY